MAVLDAGGVSGRATAGVVQLWLWRHTVATAAPQMPQAPTWCLWLQSGGHRADLEGGREGKGDQCSLSMSCMYWAQLTAGGKPQLQELQVADKGVMGAGL